MQLSKNFFLGEFTKSQTATRFGLENSPTQDQIAALTDLAKNVLQPVRDQFGPVTISSGFRSAALNRAIGGSSTSQHSRGEAADFEAVGISNLRVAEWIRDNLEFDQLILEGFNPAQGANSGWIHVSYTTSGQNRKQVLTARFVGGRAQYSKGLNVS
jgi:zinc D-Ala-D-Ala carboxypeptidase